MLRVVPQLVVADISRSVGFYSNILGFEVSTEDPPGAPEFVSLECEDACLFLVSEASRDDQTLVDDLRVGKRGVGIRLYFEVDDAPALYEHLRLTGVEMLRPLTCNEAEDYSEFLLADPDGYEIGIYS
jgi:lactoylglutathione lyase